MIGQAVLGTDESWVKFLSGIGAIVLAFLAGAELDPVVFKLKWNRHYTSARLAAAMPALFSWQLVRYWS
jgi:Kef-type K+ transport system membrane component KefB